MFRNAETSKELHSLPQILPCTEKAANHFDCRIFELRTMWRIFLGGQVTGLFHANDYQLVKPGSTVSLLLDHCL
jgi:hypothetical protein